MRSPRHKRGARDRQLDPVLERAIAQLVARMSDPSDPISQPELAARSGVDQGSISRILARQRPEASFYRVARMLHAAGLSVDAAVRAPPPVANDGGPWPIAPAAPR